MNSFDCTLNMIQIRFDDVLFDGEHYQGRHMHRKIYVSRMLNKPLAQPGDDRVLLCGECIALGVTCLTVTCTALQSVLLVEPSAKVISLVLHGMHAAFPP